MRTGRSRRSRARRRGYTLTLVVVFLLLLLTLLGTTFRQIAGVLRLEAARSKQVLRDEGALRAAAAGVALLEVGPPASDPFVTRLGIPTSSGTMLYDVTFASEPTRGVDPWSVTAAPVTAHDRATPDRSDVFTP